MISVVLGPQMHVSYISTLMVAIYKLTDPKNSESRNHNRTTEG